MAKVELANGEKEKRAVVVVGVGDGECGWRDEKMRNVEDELDLKTESTHTHHTKME